MINPGRKAGGRCTRRTVHQVHSSEQAGTIKSGPASGVDGASPGAIPGEKTTVNKTFSLRSFAVFLFLELFYIFPAAASEKAANKKKNPTQLMCVLSHTHPVNLRSTRLHKDLFVSPLSTSETGHLSHGECVTHT